MSQFLRLLDEKNKANALQAICSRVRQGDPDPRAFEVTPEFFSAVPGKPFAYWVSPSVQQAFKNFPVFENGQRTSRQGLATADDFRFVRCWWEVVKHNKKWFGFAKGGAFARFYSDMPVVVNWENSGAEMSAFSGSVIRNPEFYFRAGLTWPLRGIYFSSQLVPANCVFSVGGKMAFAPLDELGLWLAIFNSSSFDYLIRLFAGKVGGVQYQNGLIGSIPVPTISGDRMRHMSALVFKGWELRRKLASIDERFHAFMLPLSLRKRIGDFDEAAINAELERIQNEIDRIALDAYGFSDTEVSLVAQQLVYGDEGNQQDQFNDQIDDSEESLDSDSAILSWALGVASGRFDWRLVTGERAVPAQPQPFDPLPAESPGMLPDGVTPFHAHPGILVDDQGHQHDFARLVEEVLARVNAPVPQEVRRWLQRDFFAFHLQRYSKSRRKAPIYWPLSTTSGSYTLWVYYPSLTSQTLYTAINDFVEPKLRQVGADVMTLRNKGSARTRDDEKHFEALQAFEQEMIELRDTLLSLAPTYKPNHDDGVQITAAPLWPLFRHKPWQKVVKDTWAKLEKGDYDWAHLAMKYWPERVREKCKTDKSLAIAHGLEDLYIEPEAKPKKARGKKKAGGDE